VDAQNVSKWSVRLIHLVLVDGIRLRVAQLKRWDDPNRGLPVIERFNV